MVLMPWSGRATKLDALRRKVIVKSPVRPAIEEGKFSTTGPPAPFAPTWKWPAVVAAAGTKPKRIEEFAGRVNSGHAQVSVARMTSPSGWQEPGQRPEFEEITVVLRGMVRVEHDGGVIEVQAGQAIVTAPGEWVRYSTPGPDGAEYVAVCLPAFSPATVHRDE